MERSKIAIWNLTDSKLPEHIDFEEGIGPYKLATIAKENGFDVEVFQGNHFGCNSEQICAKTEEVLNNKGLVGISSFSTAKGLLEQLAKTETFSKYPLVLGGAGATTTPEQYLELFKGKNPLVLVEGDGELLFGQILDTNPADWHTIDGLWTYSSNGLLNKGNFQTLSNLDESPIIDLKPSFARKIAESKVKESSSDLVGKIIAIRALQFSHFETRRGCYYNCGFCSEPQLAKKGVRKMSPQRAVDEMVHLYSNFGITFFNFSDNIAFDKQEWWQEFATELKTSGISQYITFGGYGTPKFFALQNWFSETIPALAEVGLSFITLGVQSGSKRVLTDIIKRPVDDPENALQVVKNAVPLGINVKTDFIVGHPTETLFDLENTYTAVKRIYDSGGQAFVRKLGIVPNSQYDINLSSGNYVLPKWTDEFTSVAEKSLAYHGKKDSYKNISKQLGVVPNLEFIDRFKGVRFPKQSMSLEELRKSLSTLRNSDMYDDVKINYELLYELVIQQKSD